MAKKADLIAYSRSTGIPLPTIDKDYALSWVLAGISQHPETRRHWAFKGGTCIKKCFLSDYRYSEDLDFSLVPSGVPDISELKRLMLEIADWLELRSDVHIVRDSVRFEMYQTRSGQTSVQGRFQYRGPFRQKTNFPALTD